MQPEKIIENSVLEYINKRPNWFAFKVQSTGIYDPIKKVYRKSRNMWHINGVSDILAIHKGHFVAIEIKTKTGRLTDNQRNFISKIEGHGGTACVVRTIEEADFILSQVQDLMRGTDT